MRTFGICLHSKYCLRTLMLKTAIEPQEKKQCNIYPRLTLSALFSLNQKGNQELSADLNSTERG